MALNIPQESLLQVGMINYIWTHSCEIAAKTNKSYGVVF
jgi:hypothetical protein